MSDQYPPPGGYPPPGSGDQPPQYGAPQYGQQPTSGGPQYGQQPPQYGQQPTSGAPQYGQQPPPLHYGQPAPGAPFGAPPPPPKKSRAGRIILIIVGVVLLLAVVCCGGTYLFARSKWDQLVNSSSANAKVGDCLKGDSITGTESKDVNLQIVKCTDAAAKYQVMGITKNVSQAESLKDGTTVCDTFKELGVTTVLWQGTDVTSGDALCLKPTS